MDPNLRIGFLFAVFFDVRVLVFDFFALGLPDWISCWVESQHRFLPACFPCNNRLVRCRFFFFGSLSRSRSWRVEMALRRSLNFAGKLFLRGGLGSVGSVDSRSKFAPPAAQLPRGTIGAFPRSIPASLYAAAPCIQFSRTRSRIAIIFFGLGDESYFF